mmetsp:Transcript_56564/g.183909  ORF Transcript_56564/g.183909 Transcript_56564/m.183909 type:complete len:302 (-) Transcript_56564:17-922(-)
MPLDRVLVVGGSGRTGARLVRRLCADPTLEVKVLARDPAKAARVLEQEGRPASSSSSGAGGAVEIVQGDMLNLDAWAHILDDVDVIVTAVSCGLRTDPLVLLGLRPAPANLPHVVDADGIAQLARAAREHGVKRIVAVTTASTGTPWSFAAMFLNSLCYMSVKWKFAGEQAIRESGVDYVIIRPFGLMDTPVGEETGLGVEFSQGKTEGTRRRIAREDVARLCHEALRCPTSRSTFECWNSASSDRLFPWTRLKPDSAGKLEDVNHNIAVATFVAGIGGASALTAVSVASVTRRLLRFVRR